MNQEEQIAKIRESLFATRSSLRRWGIFFGILGLVTLADSGSPFPIPLVGMPSVIAGLASMAYGVWMLYRHQELPLSEALEIAALRGGFLSGPLLVRALRITPATAERIIEELLQRNYLRVEDRSVEGGEIGYHVVGLLPPPENGATPQ